MHRRPFATHRVGAVCILAVLAILAILAASGCGAEVQKDLGKSNPPGVLGASLTDYQGTWTGYAEAFHWNDGSDLVRIQLDADGKGTLRVGDPATMQLDPTPGGSDVDNVKLLFYELIAGLSYPIDGATVTSRRIKLATSTQVVWNGWCAAFEPVPDAVNAGRFACIPNVGWTFETGKGCRLNDAMQTQIDCSHLHCNEVCSCTETTCQVSQQNEDILIDAALSAEGEELNGTLLMGSQRINIRMMRSN